MRGGKKVAISTYFFKSREHYKNIERKEVFTLK